MGIGSGFEFQIRVQLERLAIARSNGFAVTSKLQSAPNYCGLSSRQRRA